MRIAVIGASTEIIEDLLAADITLCVVKGRDVPDDLPKGTVVVEDSMGLFEAIEPPRLYLLAIGPSPDVDRIIDTAYTTMEPGDVIVDMTGSWWCDTLRRCRRMRGRGFGYVDVARLVRRRRPLAVAAGDAAAVDLVVPLLQRWMPTIAVLPLGTSGLAHYALAIEEGIEASVYQTMNEAAQLIQAWPGSAHHELFDELWPVQDLPALGRSAWLMEDAARLEASVPHIAHAVMLNLGETLDERQAATVLPKLGPFGLPEEILG